MGLRHKIKIAAMLKIGKPRYIAILQKETDIASHYECITPSPDSPTRFEIPLEAMNCFVQGKVSKMFSFKALPIMAGSLKGMLRGFKDLKKNPIHLKTEINNEDLKALEDFASTIGVGMMGYCKLTPELIFQNKGILYENAIVVIMEMEKEKMDKAPSYDSFHEVHRTYRDLGYVTNDIADFLRSRGFGAHPVHPLGGAVLYPPLAKKAGLGWQGRHGMLITPKFGPRMRIAAVFTSIENLPITEENPHSWIEKFCATCGLCIRKCPTKAIRESVIKYGPGLLNHIDREKCFPYFIEEHGCSVCIKECQFNKIGYEHLKAKFENRKGS